MNDASISNEIILNAVTVSKLDEFGSQLWDAMKEYIVSHEDTSNLMIQIKSKLDQANREVIGTTGTQKADAIKDGVYQMVLAFEDCGIDMTNIKTSQFSSIIREFTKITGVFILDENNKQWSSGEWEEASTKQVMPNPVGILVVLADNEIIISLDYVFKQWGTYGSTIPILDGYAGGIAGTPKSGFKNTKRILAYADPGTLRNSSISIDYFNGMTESDVTNKDIVFFPDDTSLTTWAASVGNAGMARLGQEKYYCIPHAEAGYWIVKYYTGTASSITFGNRITKTPLIDTQSIIGSPSAKWCWDYKAYDGDTHQWYEPSVFELGVMYLNRDEIDKCLIVLGKERLYTSSYHWSSLQFNNSYAYFVSLSSGEVNNYYKSYGCAVRAVTSR